MKICHCVKLSDEEKKSLLTVRGLLRDACDDIMLSRDFDENYGISLEDIASWVDDVNDFLERWQ